MILEFFCLISVQFLIIDAATLQPIDTETSTFFDKNEIETFFTTEFQVETIKPYVPLVLNPNITNAEYFSKPNRGFLDWIFGIFNFENNNHFPSSSGSGTSTINNITPQETCPPCTCGKTNEGQRIVGGIITKINQYPWMIALKYNNRFFCGGSLINSRYILTAGHCTVGISKDRLVAVFMEHDRTDPSETKSFTVKIDNILRHKSYNSGGSYNNDIALLKLKDNVPLQGEMRPVCLPIIGKSYTNMTGRATGWGATAEYGQTSTKLREVDVPIMSNDDCKKTNYGDRITINMLCAGYPEGGKDACQGDSGGPLHITDGSQYSVVGITSWGEGCAGKNYPGVYTRVNRYITWIKTNTKEGCYCD